jgi:hypothetical protein
MLDWPVDKIRLIYELALTRQKKQAAVEDLRWLRVLRVAIASVLGKPAVATQFERKLVREAGLKGERPSKPNAMLDQIQKVLGH